MRPATPRFSIVHPSARPNEWAKTRDEWLAAASGQETVEYVVCFDWGHADVSAKDAAPARVVWNYGVRCSVDATNCAAAAASGKVMVVISDDIHPAKHWDKLLRKVPQLWGGQECVVRVKTGGSADQRGLMAVQILNRERYDRIGYLFYPGYVSMYADDEYSIHAKGDDVVVDTDILMEHDHWTNNARPMDEVYARQNAAERYRWGQALLTSRLSAGFPREYPTELRLKRQLVAAEYDMAAPRGESIAA